MQDKKPDWNIWLLMPSVSVADAIALTLNRDPPAMQSDWSKPTEFKDRVMLCRAVHGAKVAPALLAEWAQSVGWNIPTALAGLAPRPGREHPPVDAELVINSLADIAMPGESSALYAALLAFGVRFSGRADALEMNTPDDTVNGRTEPVSGGAVKSLCGQAGGEALGRIVRGSGAVGGGARHSSGPFLFGTASTGSGIKPPTPNPPGRPAIGKPDWDEWAYRLNATLPEAVALAMNFETNYRGDYPDAFCNRVRVARERMTPDGPLRNLHPNWAIHSTVSLSEFGAWWLGMGWELPQQFPRPAPACAEPAGAPVADAEPVKPLTTAAAPLPPAGAVSSVQAGALPQPLTTADVAENFAGLRWTAEQWKKPLGSPPAWLRPCRVQRGQRGVRESLWDPVKIASALVTKGSIGGISARARFQTKERMKPWLEAWITYEADFLDTV